VLFTHNDSGDDARFFAVDDSCRTLATYVLPGVDSSDWEDMARGPGPDGKPVLWFGDIGDNAMMRSEVVVQRVAEPEVRRAAKPVPVTSVAFRFAYEDGAPTPRRCSPTRARAACSSSPRPTSGSARSTPPPRCWTRRASTC
jgi:hypothetical protein